MGLNFKVFPATLTPDGRKVPLIKGWNESATTDPVQLKIWSDLFRDRLKFWGVPCGKTNGIFALDIDVKNANGFESLKKLGHELPNTLIQRTPSGGAHAIFLTNGRDHYPNSSNREFGLDTRGDGGWIAYYGSTNGLEPIPVPDWLMALATNTKKPETTASPIKLAPEIAEGIFKTCLENIENAQEGERNDTLNREAFKIGQLVAAGSFTSDFAQASITTAAEKCGLRGYEITATVHSALSGGGRHPLTSPFGTDEPKATFAIPAAPESPGRWTPQYLTRSDLLNTSKLRKPQLFKDWSTCDIQLVTADGGTGKTTLKLFEAICLALGDRFLGFDCCQRGKTLFITGEDSTSKLAAMLGAMMNQMGLFDGRPENEAKVETILSSIIIKKDDDLCLIIKDKQGFLHPSREAMNKILEAVEDIKPLSIVFDPIASFWGSESALNDMAKAVTRFCSRIVDQTGCSIELINHMGKVSSAAKDITQFAGRGGSALPSHSRVSKVLRNLNSEEFSEMTGSELLESQQAILCVVNKFSDGSPLLGKPFIVLRQGYLFSKLNISPEKTREIDRQSSDVERIFTFISECRRNNQYPTERVIVGHFSVHSDSLSKEKVKNAIAILTFHGYLGQKIVSIDNPNLTLREKVFIITDNNGKET